MFACISLAITPSLAQRLHALSLRGCAVMLAGSPNAASFHQPRQQIENAHGSPQAPVSAHVDMLTHVGLRDISVNHTDMLGTGGNAVPK